MEVQESGIYIVKDEYFNTYYSEHWMWNKHESRPQFLSIRDSGGLMWMIPMSSKIDNYRAKIVKVEQKQGAGNCLYYHIGTIASKERAFIISGLFPVTPAYISHPYCINHQPYIVRDRQLNRQLRSKTMRYLRLLEQHVLQDQNHVLQIRAALLSK